MEKISHFPLRAQEDALKRALIVGGFTLIDNGAAPEIEPTDWAITLFKRPDGASRKPVLLEKGAFALRSELLAAQLSRLAGELPLRAFAVGTVYDGNDAAHPQHRVIQGVWADGNLSPRKAVLFGEKLAETVFGVGTKVISENNDPSTIVIDVEVGEKTFPFALVGKATPLARAILGLAGSEVTPRFFEIDVDAVAMAVYGLASRDELYTPIYSKLAAVTDTVASFNGDLYTSRAANLLRRKGFCEYAGLHAYEADCYKKMNMIQEAWDTNNVGVQLVEPLGASTGLPTVLTPALEEAIAANWKAGEETCKLFELRHIFLPNPRGDAPVEKVALAFGGYAPDMDKVAFRKLVDGFLTEFGIRNHFFIPLPPGKAPAYHPADGWLVMDQNMTYLECNFGSISPVALANHGIGTQAFMAMFEFAPLQKKAAEEFDYVMPDYQ